MKNILLPTDFSENSWNAIKYAISFFENLECNFYVLHVSQLTNLIGYDMPIILSQETIENLYLKPSKQRLRSMLKRISKLKLKQSNHKFYTLAESGFFIESVRKNVDEKQIDCIVMGTKGATGLEKIILGSNTADIITKVKCNTLAVPEKAHFVIPKEIAFPTDLSLSNNLQILQPIMDIIERFHSVLRIVHIIKSKSDLNENQQKNKELLEDYFNSYAFTFNFLTNKNVEDAIQCFVESRGIQMICMVAKNLNYFQQILFHSKVEAISYHTEIPFLVLHEKT